MVFYPNQLFHIYNQGNNRRQIFFTDEHYLYFLWKMRAYLLPFGDLIAYCLMPNHFHWQFFVQELEIEVRLFREHADEIEYRRRVHKYGGKARPVHRDWSRIKNEDDTLSLNAAIGILEQSYTQAINREKGFSGSLFRKPCKAKDGWIDECITIEKPNGRPDFRFLPGTGYAFQCFCYIHDNPKEAGLVENSLDWKYSSARDYAGLREGTLVNVELGKQLMGLD